MSENKKEIHIVFQVLNFVFRSNKIKLLIVDKLILIALASHKGLKGIFPMQETLANEIGITIRHLRNRIKFLQKIGLLNVQKVGRKHYYYFDKLSTIEELQYPYPNSIEELQFRSQGNYSSANRGTTVPHINKEVSNKVNNTERARKSRTPLSDHFLPDEKRNNLLKETAVKARKSEEQLLSKFKNLQKSKQGVSADWNAELENFLINERPAGYLNGNGNGHAHGNGEIKSTVKFFHDPTHPSYETFKQNIEMRKEQQTPTEEVEAQPTEHLSFREVKRRHELRLLEQGELKNVSDAGNSGGGCNSQ